MFKNHATLSIDESVSNFDDSHICMQPNLKSKQHKVQLWTLDDSWGGILADCISFTHSQIERVVVCRNICYWAGIVALSYTDSTNRRNRKPPKASDHDGLRWILTKFDTEFLARHIQFTTFLHKYVCDQKFHTNSQ